LAIAAFAFLRRTMSPSFMSFLTIEYVVNGL
jgi:hypothetical protein